MGLSESSEFWRIVGRPLSIDDLKVGQAAILDETDVGRTRVVIVTRKTVKDVGDAVETGIEFRDAWPGEVVESPTTVIVV